MPCPILATDRLFVALTESSPLRYCRLVLSDTLATPIHTLLRTHTHTHTCLSDHTGSGWSYSISSSRRQTDPTCQSEEDITTWAEVVGQRRKERKEEEKKKERGAETRSAAQFIELSRRAKLGRENRPDPPLSPLTLVASFLFFKPNLTCGPYKSATQRA